MAKKKTARTPQEQLEDLAVEGYGWPEGALDDELEDATEADRQLTLEQLKGSVLLGQLQYLYERGYTVARLRELLTEAKES